MMTASDEAKGLKEVLEECGFDVKHLKAKCSPVCPFKSQNCCMAQYLLQQDDFKDQKFMVEAMIKKASHLCVFLPKFHYELNPIVMVSLLSNCAIFSVLIIKYSTGDDVSIITRRSQRPILLQQRQWH